MTGKPFPFAAWVSREAAEAYLAEAGSVPPSADIEAVRQHYDSFNRRLLTQALGSYPVEVTANVMAGVPCHVVEPPGGARDDRCLICLHGGAFMWGSGAGAMLEAVPVSAVTGMRVIALDYRLAPEHRFPAAVDDVLGVYRALLADYGASRIGIYGCSAGASLTAQSIARMIVEGIDLPGGIGMFHAAGLELAGDSVTLSSVLHGGAVQAETPSFETLPYFAGTSAGDPLALPGNHPEMLKLFPPALLISGTRDFAASSVSVMHRRLLAAGVDARLILFDGMWHAHHMFAMLPESRETFAAIKAFFDRALA
jgi:acetyl esterase/lipase